MFAETVTTPPPDQRLHSKDRISAGQPADAGSHESATTGARTADSAHDDAVAAGKGDLIAFERFYRAQMPRVYSLVARMIGNQVEAEEVVQDVFVRAWRKLPTFRGDSAVSTWLHRLAVNVVLSRRKSEGIRKDRTSDDEFAIDLAPARQATVGERVDLEGAIALLPSGARRVFVLHDVEGFTHEEIGGQLGITPGGSKAQLHRARLLLREALNR
jgi:RNA polymerase sigma-70 factor (ECF subfamily)